MAVNRKPPTVSERRRYRHQDRDVYVKIAMLLALGMLSISGTLLAYQQALAIALASGLHLKVHLPLTAAQLSDYLTPTLIAAYATAIAGAITTIGGAILLLMTKVQQNKRGVATSPDTPTVVQAANVQIQSPVAPVVTGKPALEVPPDLAVQSHHIPLDTPK